MHHVNTRNRSRCLFAVRRRLIANQDLEETIAIVEESPARFKIGPLACSRAVSSHPPQYNQKLPRESVLSARQRNSFRLNGAADDVRIDVYSRKYARRSIAVRPRPKFLRQTRR